METDELKNQRVTVNVTMFKQVLKKEFGEIRGVARAKRKPYILVVQSVTLKEAKSPLDF